MGSSSNQKETIMAATGDAVLERGLWLNRYRAWVVVLTMP